MVQPTVPPPPQAQPQPAKRGGGWLLWLGIALIVAGIVGSIVTFVLQNNQYEQSVKKLARAVPGFSTRLDFQTSGTYSLYYENKGEFSAQLDGEPTDVKLDAPDAPVDFSATLTDGDGNDVRIHQSSDDVTYDVAGHRGDLVSSVDITEPGDYQLQIASDDPADDGPNSYAIAVGKGQVSKPSVLWPALILAIGLIVGVLAIIVGARQRRAPAAAAVPAGAFAAPPPGSEPAGGYAYDPTAPSPAGYAPPPPGPAAGAFAPPTVPSEPGWPVPPAGGLDAPPNEAAPRPYQFDPPTQPTPATEPTPTPPWSGFDPPTEPTPPWSGFEPPTRPVDAPTQPDEAREGET
jgi:hypothetical protein